MTFAERLEYLADQIDSNIDNMSALYSLLKSNHDLICASLRAAASSYTAKKNRL